MSACRASCLRARDLFQPFEKIVPDFLARAGSAFLQTMKYYPSRQHPCRGTIHTGEASFPLAPFGLSAFSFARLLLARKKIQVPSSLARASVPTLLTQSHGPAGRLMPTSSLRSSSSYQISRRGGGLRLGAGASDPLARQTQAARWRAAGTERGEASGSPSPDSILHDEITAGQNTHRAS